MTSYKSAQEHLNRNAQTWLVTGAAGFIGSNIVEHLLRLNQHVIGFDNFATGHQRNLDEVHGLVSPEQWTRFTMVRADIRNLEECRRACRDVQFVLHHAAVGSVPHSIEDPLYAHAVNVTGTLNLLVAAREAKVRRFVYASSSAVYGDDATLPKIESTLGNCLSPYAVSKLADELYAQVFGRCYGLETVGLRYFNIFGPRQDPNGAYAAVIPKWISAMIHGEEVVINGDGETTRDFCYVADVVQANILAATSDSPDAIGGTFNVARHSKTTLNELFEILRGRLARFYPHLEKLRPTYRDFRLGDVRHSDASIDAAQRILGYTSQYTVVQGLDTALDWYRKNLGEKFRDAVATSLSPSR